MTGGGGDPVPPDPGSQEEPFRKRGRPKKTIDALHKTGRIGSKNTLSPAVSKNLLFPNFSSICNSKNTRINTTEGNISNSPDDSFKCPSVPEQNMIETVAEVHDIPSVHMMGDHDLDEVQPNYDQIDQILSECNSSPNLSSPQTVVDMHSVPRTPPRSNSNSNIPDLSEPLINSQRQNDKSSYVFTRNVNRYSNTDKCPFIVYIECIDKNISRLHPLAMGKKIFNAYPQFRNDILNIAPMNRSTIKIEVKSAKVANEIVSKNMFVNENYNLYIPTHLIQRQGVIHNVDTSISDDELLSELESQVKVLKIKRIMRKSNDILSPTSAVIINFAGQSLPDYVYAYRVRFPVKPYIYKVMQCFSCLRYGHAAKFCKFPARCNRCKGQHNSRDCTDESPPICINCDQNHLATDHKNCSAYKEQKIIKEYMANNNTTYFEAKNSLKSANTYANMLRSEPHHEPRNLPSINNQFKYRNYESSYPNNNQIDLISSQQSKKDHTQNRPYHNNRQTQISHTQNHTQRNSNQTQIDPNLLYSLPQLPLNPIIQNPYRPEKNYVHDNLVEIISNIVSNILANIFKNPISTIPSDENIKSVIVEMLSEGHAANNHDGSRR